MGETRLESSNSDNVPQYRQLKITDSDARLRRHCIDVILDVTTKETPDSIPTAVEGREIQLHLTLKMRFILNPEFMIREQHAHILQRLELFTELCTKLTDKSSKDPSVQIFKYLSQAPTLTGLPQMDKLITVLKEVVFASQGLGKSSDKVYNEPHTICHRKFSYKFLEYNTVKAIVSPTCERLQLAMTEHLKTVSEFKAAQKVILQNFNGFISATDILSDARNEYDNTRSAGDHLHTLKERSKIQMDIQEKLMRKNVNGIVDAYKDVNAAQEKEQQIKETLLIPLSEKLIKVARSFVLSRIEDGIQSLLQVCKTEKLSKQLIHELELFDSKRIATEIVDTCCVKYCFPDIQETPLNAFVPEPYYKYPSVGIKSKTFRQYNFYDDIDNLQHRVNDISQMENQYVIALRKVKAQQPGQITMKKGTQIKQKLVSQDAAVAYGWTRLFKGAPKRYGFYAVDATRQLS